MCLRVFVSQNYWTYIVGGMVYLSLFEILRVVLASNNRLTVFDAEEKRLVVTATLTGSCLSGL